MSLAAYKSLKTPRNVFPRLDSITWNIDGYRATYRAADGGLLSARGDTPAEAIAAALTAKPYYIESPQYKPHTTKPPTTKPRSTKLGAELENMFKGLL